MQLFTLFVRRRINIVIVSVIVDHPELKVERRDKVKDKERKNKII